MKPEASGAYVRAEIAKWAGGVAKANSRAA
jgi:hypothetical protein